MVKLKSSILILALVLLSCLPLAFSQSEIIFPRVDILNQSSFNFVNASTTLPIVPNQKVSEVVLKSTDFTLFKQRNAGDYVQITIINFNGSMFSNSSVNLMLTSYTPNSATFAIYDLTNKLINSNINISKDASQDLGITLNGKPMITLAYLGLDVSNLPSYKVKAYLAPGQLYYKGNFCSLSQDKSKYKCYVEDPATKGVAETYELNASDLQLSGISAANAVQNLVKQEAINKSNVQASTDAKNNIQQVGTAHTSIDWWKILLSVVVIILIVILFLKGRKVKKSSSEETFTEEEKW